MDGNLIPQTTLSRQETRAIPQAASRLRVAIVSDAVLGRNGVGTYYQDLLCQIQGDVEDIQLYCPAQEPDPSLERFSLPMLGDCTQRLAFPKSRELCRRLARQSPNVLVIPSLGAYSYVALRFARHHRIPIAVVNHTSFDRLIDLYWPGRCSFPLKLLLGRVQRWLIGQATGVAAMDAVSLGEARKMQATLVRVMGTPISSAFLTTPRAPVPRKPNRVIFVGRLAPEKRLDEILSAASIMPELEFFIAGDGPMKELVLSLTERLPNLHYLGWLDRDHVLDAMDRADMLVLPSSLETFGTVALEALARKRFVIVSRECGISAWPTLSKALFYIENGESLTATLDRMIQLPPKARVQHASQSWLAVEDFNRHTLRSWLRFLVDVAGMESEDSSARQVSERVSLDKRFSVTTPR